MKFSTLVLLFSITFFTACSKGGDGTTPTPTPTPTETAIAFTVNVDPGAGNVLAVVGTSQIMNVKISTALPTAGVTVAITVTKDADNSSIFSSSNASVNADNSVTITGLTPGVLCTATVVVASKSTATNTKSTSFKLAAK